MCLLYLDYDILAILVTILIYKVYTTWHEIFNNGKYG